MSEDGAGVPEVSFGQLRQGGPEDDKGRPPGGEQTADWAPTGTQRASQAAQEADDEVPPSTWLPPQASPQARSYDRYGSASGPRWGPNYVPGYGAAGNSRYRSRRSGYQSSAGYGYRQHDFGPGDDMGPVRTLLAYAAFRWRTRRRRKRHILLAFFAIWVILVIIGAVVDGGSSSDSSSGDSSSDWNPPSGVVHGAVGQALTLYGFQDGEKMSVTVAKVLPDAQAGDDFSRAAAGKRLYAVQFRLADTGSAAYDDSPQNGTLIVDSAGRTYKPTFQVQTVVGCPMYEAVLSFPAGSARTGCMGFEVPANAKVTQVRFTLDSGLAAQTGQWNVAG